MSQFLNLLGGGLGASSSGGGGGPTASAQQVVYVSKGGSDGLGAGTITNPYLTVQFAVSSISDAATGKRYMVDVGPGAYTGSAMTSVSPYISFRGAGGWSNGGNILSNTSFDFSITFSNGDSSTPYFYGITFSNNTLNLPDGTAQVSGFSGCTFFQTTVVTKAVTRFSACLGAGIVSTGGTQFVTACTGSWAIGHDGASNTTIATCTGCAFSDLSPRQNTGTTTITATGCRATTLTSYGTPTVFTDNDLVAPASITIGTGTLTMTPITATAVQAAYGTGTAYSLTNTAAALDFGTTDPAIVIPGSGTWKLSAIVQLNYTGATVVTETATLKLRRTNNTAADIANTTLLLDLPVATTLTNTYGTFALMRVLYTTTNANDAIAIFGSVSATLGAGTIDATAACLLAERQ